MHIDGEGDEFRLITFFCFKVFILGFLPFLRYYACIVKSVSKHVFFACQKKNRVHISKIVPPCHLLTKKIERKYYKYLIINIINKKNRGGTLEARRRHGGGTTEARQIFGWHDSICATRH